MEHSRSNRWTTSPDASPRIWTSTCRGSVTNRSRNTVPSPNAEAASLRALLTASDRSAGPATSRMPRPPPPNAALTSSGKPTSAAAASRSVWSVTVTLGRVGTPASAMAVLAAILSPMASMVSGAGPTKISPALAQDRANAAFSDRKP